MHATSRAKKSISKSEKLVSSNIFQNEYFFNNYGQTLFLDNIFSTVCVETEKKDILLHKSERTHCKSWILCANIFPRKSCSHVLDRLGVGVFVLNFKKKIFLSLFLRLSSKIFLKSMGVLSISSFFFFFYIIQIFGNSEFISNDIQANFLINWFIYHFS